MTYCNGRVDVGLDESDVMHHLDIPAFLGLLVLLLGAAKLCGGLAQRFGQPAVLGELVAGVLLGAAALALTDLRASESAVLHSLGEVGASLAASVRPAEPNSAEDPRHMALHLFSEIGVIILLFAIGLETDLSRLLRVGGSATVVALVGVALPFALGYGACLLLGLTPLVAVVTGSALTATSVGITARVLSDLGRLQDPESQIVLGAAVLDDVIGLVILTVVAGLTRGEEVTVLGAVRITAVAFGFLIGTLLVGWLIVPPLFRLVAHIDWPGTATILAVMLALGLAWLADTAGSALIIGAFAAGLLLTNAPQAKEIEHGVAQLGHLFVPLFFVSVGAAVDVRVFNPLDSANLTTWQIGGLLVVAAVLGKFVAGFAPYWFRGRKTVVGVGMIPRGEVGLIFAKMGLESGVFDAGMFGAVTMMVLVTTFLAPPLLKLLLPPRPSDSPPPKPEGIEDLVTEP